MYVLPAPVGAWTTTSFPSRSRLTASCCHLSGMIRVTIAYNVLRERPAVNQNLEDRSQNTESALQTANGERNSGRNGQNRPRTLRQRASLLFSEHGFLRQN